MGALLLLTKFAIVLSAFVVGLAFILDAVAYATAFFHGSSAYPIAKPAWLFAFAVLGLISFFIAWRVVVVPMLGPDRAGYHRTVVER